MKTDVKISCKVKNINHPKWPQWFAIENYDVLAELTGKEFLHELESRLNLFNTPTFANGQRMTDDRTWQQILRGDIVLNIFDNAFRTSPSARVLTPLDIMEVSDRIMPRSNQAIIDFDNTSTLFAIEGSHEKLAILALNIAQFDDKAILDEVAFLLSQLRQQQSLSQATNQRPSQASDNTFKKLFTYKIIPYLDLMLYCHNHILLNQRDEWQELSFSQPALIALLFNNEIDNDRYKKTILPFYKKILNDELHLVRLLSNAKQDSYLLSTKMKYISG